MAFNKLFICTLLIISVISNQTFLTKAKLPSFVIVGNYVQYEQQFSTGELYELFWNITHVNTSVIGITIRSHGIQRNLTSGEMPIVPSGGTMLIDKDTWKIVQVIIGNVTKNIGEPIGEKVPFWIPISVNETTPIDTMYDQDVTPTTQSLNLSYFQASRSCWVTNNIYSETASMQRWYDKKTGIVLRIATEIKFGIIKISVLETINATNITTLSNEDSSYSSSSFSSSIMTRTTSFLGLWSLLLLIFSFIMIQRMKENEKS